MRLLFFMIMVLGGTVFGQSKKELRLALERSSAKIDSLQSILISERLTSQQKSDSLQAVIDDTQKRLNAQYLLTKTQDESIRNCTGRNASLRSENEQLRESLRQTQSKTTTKTKKEATDPFFRGQGGSGNGNSFGVGNDNGEGGSGLGPGSSLEMKESYKHRILISKPDFGDIKVQAKCKIVFTFLINPEGKIVSQPVYDKSKSTTNDEELIKKVADKLMLDTQYSKSNTTANEKMTISVSL